jgi:hypothetical protein
VPFSPLHRRVTGAAAITLTVLGTAIVLAAPAEATAFITGNARRAVSYAEHRGETAAVAVLDTRTGRFYGAGPYHAEFATESVVKVFIATRLLLTGRMHGSVERTAYKMITQSDDASASALYGLSGGDRVVPLLARHYHVKHLGSPPSRGGWWGNTHVTAGGLVHFYAKVKRDHRVGPWLIHAMRHATVHGSDGTYQYFGIPAAASSFAIKQGWGADSNCFCTSVFNSTGYVDHDRFAVAMLTSGGPYGQHAMVTLDGMARRLMPAGHIDPAWHNPVLRLALATHHGNSVRLAGYAYDRDRPGTALTVRVYTDGKLVLRAPTDRVRPNLNTIARLRGPHGFNVHLTVPNGQHVITVRTANVGRGTSGRYVTRHWLIDGNARGALESVTTPAAGNVQFRGWTFDPDQPAHSNSVQIRQDGAVIGTYPADVARPDIDSKYRIEGRHGFDVSVANVTAGTHEFCVYGTNRGSALADPVVELGCTTQAVQPASSGP